MAKAGKKPDTEANTRKKIPSRRSKIAISDVQKRRMIAEAAFYNSQKREQLGGDPLQDWLLAEQQIEQQLIH